MIVYNKRTGKKANKEMQKSPNAIFILGSLFFNSGGHQNNDGICDLRNEYLFTFKKINYIKINHVK